MIDSEAVRIVSELRQRWVCFGMRHDGDFLREVFLPAKMQELAEISPFEKLAETALLLEYYFPLWLTRRFATCNNIRSILHDAVAQLTSDILPFLEVTIVSGVAISDKFPIGSRSYICPPSQLPWHPFGHLFQKITSYGLRPDNDKAALVQVAQLKMAKTEEAENTNKEAENLRNEERSAIRNALLLQSASCVALSESFCAYEVDSIYVTGYSSFQTGRSLVCGSQHTPDASLVPEYYLLLKAFGTKNAGLAIDTKARKSISLAFDYLAKAREFDDSANAAINFGIAAELLLKHGDDNGNGEITNKITTRAAWLLGLSVDERVEVKKRMSGLYQARSDVVHKGQIGKPFAYSEYNDLLTSLLLAITRQGCFPDWNRLVLGDQPAG